MINKEKKQIYDTISKALIDIVSKSFNEHWKSIKNISSSTSKNNALVMLQIGHILFQIKDDTMNIKKIWEKIGTLRAKITGHSTAARLYPNGYRDENWPAL